MLLLTAAGLAVRLVFLALERADLAGDEPSWAALAVRDLAHLRRPFSPWKTPLIFYPPAYPYFLAFFYRLLGGLEAVKWVQALVGSLVIPAVGRIGSLAFSSRAGLVAAAIAAFYPDLVWFSVHFWSETLFMVLLWWGCERLLAADATGRRAAAVAAGVLFGLASLARETALPFTPVAALWLASSPRTGSRARGAGFLLAAALTIAPWTYRNWVVFHAFVPVSTFAALNLWQGNGGLTREELYRQFDAVEGPIAQYRFAWTMGLRAIARRQPTWLVEKLWTEMPRFWGAQSEAVLHFERGAYEAAPSWAEGAARLATGLPYLAVLAVSVPGLAAVSWGRARALLILFLGYYTLIHVVTYGSDRYRLPAMPVLFVFAAGAWTAWRDGALSDLGPRRKALAWGLGLVMAIVAAAGSQ